jgi:hypothetical protein
LVGSDLRAEATSALWQIPSVTRADEGFASCWLWTGEAIEIERAGGIGCDFPEGRRVGLKLFKNGMVDQEVNPVAVQSGGSLALGGEFTQVNLKSRARIGGGHQFHGVHVQGWLWTADANRPVYSVVSAREGLRMGAESTGFNGRQRSTMVRLVANGSPESRFNAGLGLNGVVRAIAVDSNGRIPLGGGLF